MYKLKLIFAVSIAFFANECFAEWSDVLNVKRVEIHSSGVFLVAEMSGLTAPGCEGNTYTFAQFPKDNEKLADRALSSVYYAQSTSKKIRVAINRCDPNYAIASGIWVE